MTVKTFVFSPFQENTYIVYSDSKDAIIIDAGCYNDVEKQNLKHFIESNDLNIKNLLNTHLHLDHQFGNKFVSNTFGLEPQAHIEDEFLLENVNAQARSFGMNINEDAHKLGKYIIDNEVIEFDNSQIRALHVPGHSPGSLAFYFEKEGMVFVGDVLFRGSIGRTDLPKGDYATLINSITKKLLPLPDSTVVYSGHGPTTTIGYEKINNPYL
jgi:glyoxylase-like metal-dependent hydrolase (beta-lactamase superfamily II)